MKQRRLKRKPLRWDYAVVSVVNEEPFVSEALWEKGDDGYELASVIQDSGGLQLFFRRKK